MGKKLRWCAHKQGYYSHETAERALRPVMNYYRGRLKLRIVRCEGCQLWIHVRLKAINEA